MPGFEVFHDGDCPLCRREVATLRHLDRNHRITFTDIASPDFDARSLGLTHERMMAKIHGRTADGTLVEGVEVFRQIYSALGFAPLVALTRLPGIRTALDAAYAVFARNRLRLTGRSCDTGTCSTSTR